MKFKKLKIQNFGAISKAEMALNNRGLVLIHGDNQDDSAANSNGAGKSTVVEAISWVLYGKTAKGISGDHVINRSAKKNCAVTLTLEEDGAVYTIKRGRKDKDLKNNLHVFMEDDAGKTVDLTKGTDKLTQPVVDQIMGCPYDVFTAAVYSGQEQMPDLPNMTDKHLKMLIEEAAGITQLEEAYVIARNRLRDRKDDLDELESDIERQETKVENAKLRVKDAKESERQWVAERDARIMDLETEARVAIRSAKTLKSELEKLRSEEDIQVDRDKLADTIAGLDKERDKLSDLQAAHDKEESRADRVKSDAERETNRFKRFMGELADLKEEIGRPCETCGRPHDEESLKSAIDAKKAEAGAAKDAAKTLIDEYKGIAQSVTDALERVEVFKRSMTDTTTAFALSDDLTQQLDKVRDTRRDYERAVERAQECTRKIKAENAAKNPYTDTIADRQKEVDVQNDSLKELKAKLPAARKALQVATDVTSVYAPKGVRAHVLDTVTPYLNERTAHYLGALSDGAIEAIWQTITLSAKGEPRENFSIEVSHSGTGSFATLSGGEKRKVRISCALALQDLVATRASKSLDLYIADEIDAALDVASLERLMMVLNEKARERGSVFIVSHSDLRDWVSNVMVVRKSGGSSEIVTA